MDSKQLNKAVRATNKAISALGNYHEGLPIAQIQTILSDNGLDGSELDGIYCGREGRAVAKVHERRYLQFNW